MKVVKVSAIWCGACLIMNKRWKEINAKYNFETISLDVDVDDDVVEKYNTGEKLPVFIFILPFPMFVKEKTHILRRFCGIFGCLFILIFRFLFGRFFGRFFLLFCFF